MMMARAAWVSAAVVVVAFFLPWARLDIRTTALEQQISLSARRSLAKSFGTRRAPKTTPKRLATIPSRVTGAQIPVLANRKHVKVATGLVELFTKRREAIGLKSYAVYLVPGLAILCALLLSLSKFRRSAAPTAALLCAAIAVGGFWTLWTTDTRKLYGIVIGEGLWLSLGAYVVLAASAAWLALPSSLLARLGALRHSDRTAQ